MCDPQYDELNAMIAEALRDDKRTVEVDVNVLMILIAKAQMQRFPIYVPPPVPFDSWAVTSKWPTDGYVVYTDSTSNDDKSMNVDEQ